MNEAKPVISACGKSYTNRIWMYIHKPPIVSKPVPANEFHPLL
jgi:hypothetical protein